MSRVIKFLNEYPFFKASSIIIGLAVVLLIALKIGDSIGRLIYFIKHS